MMLFMALSTLAVTQAAANEPSALEKIVNELDREAADRFVQPNHNEPGIRWRPPVLNGRFSTEVCQAAHEQGGGDTFLDRIAELHRLSVSETRQLHAECDIWSDGHNEPSRMIEMDPAPERSTQE